MKDDAVPAAGARKETDDFLRRKTGAVASAGPEPAAHAPLHTDSAFAEKVGAAMDTLPAFAALVIGIETTDAGAPRPDGATDRTAAVVETACRDGAGLWGLLETDLYGCVLPGLSADEAKIRAEAMRDAMAAGGTQTVLIGVAAFPHSAFEKDEILGNALKALDHAAFFGAGSVVAFDAVSLNVSADKRYQEGDLSGAIEELQRALDLDAENYNVQNSLGVCYAELGAYEKALKIFETAMTLAPKDAMAVYNAGLAHLRMGDREHALERFLQADAMDGATFEVCLQTGRLYQDMHKPAKARPYLERAVQCRAESGIAQRYLGECLLALDRIEAAAVAYKKAVRCNPNDAEALSAMGCLFDRMGENPEISTLFCRQSIDLAPDNGVFRRRLGELLLKQNRLEEALQTFMKAEELGQDVRSLLAETRERLTLEAS